MPDACGWLLQVRLYVDMNGSSHSSRDSLSARERISQHSCRLGYTADHATFALLYVVLLGWVLHFRRRIPRFPQGLYCGLLAFNVPIHAMLGGICYSRTISAVLHAHLATSPVFWLSGALFILNSLLLFLCLGAGLIIFGNQFFVLAVKVCSVNLLLFMGYAALNLAYPADFDGSLVLHPEAGYNERNLHWAVWLRAFILRLGILHAHVAAQISYHRGGMDVLTFTVGTARPCIAPLKAYHPASTPLASKWLWVSALVGLLHVDLAVKALLRMSIISQENLGMMFLCGTLAGVCVTGGITAFGVAAFNRVQLWSRHLFGIGFLSTAVGSVLLPLALRSTDWFLIRAFAVSSLHPWHGRMRALLEMATFPDEHIWWLVACAGCAALVVTMLPYSRRCLESWRTHSSGRETSYFRNGISETDSVGPIQVTRAKADPRPRSAGRMTISSMAQDGVTQEVALNRGMDAKQARVDAHAHILEDMPPPNLALHFEEQMETGARMPPSVQTQIIHPGRNVPVKSGKARATSNRAAFPQVEHGVEHGGSNMGSNMPEQAEHGVEYGG